jgi:hypothetical protein
LGGLTKSWVLAVRSGPTRAGAIRYSLDGKYEDQFLCS